MFLDYFPCRRLVLKMKTKLLNIAKTAIASVQPRSLFNNLVKAVPGGICIEKEFVKLPSSGRRSPVGGRIIVAGAGKASGSMAFAIEKCIGKVISDGIVLVKSSSNINLKKIKLLEAGHPVPDARTIEGTKAVKELLHGLTPEDVVIALISGGGSSLLELPKEGISLKALKHLTNLLLRSGASITVLNKVRRFLSQVKGGALAKWAAPARVYSFILSDVIGNKLETIASGPTVLPEQRSVGSGGKEGAEVKCLLERYNVWDKVPVSIRAVIEKDIESGGNYACGPKVPQVVNYLIGDISIAANAALQAARKKGVNTLFLTCSLEGEAREVAKVFCAIAKEIREHGRPVPPPAIIISGGELTVTVKGKGKGGRCQELALAFALAVGGSEECKYKDAMTGTALLAVGTDGSDGPTDAAGAYADDKTVSRGIKKGLDPVAALANNDAYHFFKRAGDLIYTGHTGTNVGDLYLLAVDKL